MKSRIERLERQADAQQSRYGLFLVVPEDYPDPVPEGYRRRSELPDLSGYDYVLIINPHGTHYRPESEEGATG